MKLYILELVMHLPVLVLLFSVCGNKMLKYHRIWNAHFKALLIVQSTGEREFLCSSPFFASFTHLYA
jgi:hypothetical protein